MKKNAFTLAEVLITLVIIGVVAALTIPTLIKANNKIETEAKLKETYSILSNAIKIAEIDNGRIWTWNWGNSTAATTKAALREYIFPNLKNYTECGDGNNSTCFYTGSYKNLFDVPYYDITSDNLTTFSLPNGVAVGIFTGPTSPYGLQIFMDINGSKSPNVFGKDAFQWYYFPDYPSILGRNHGAGTLEDNKIVCSMSDKSYQGGIHNGINCAARIMQEGWQINYW